MMFGFAESKHPRVYLMVKLYRMHSNLSDPNPPTLQPDGQTDGRTDRRHAMAILRFALKCIAR